MKKRQQTQLGLRKQVCIMMIKEIKLALLQCDSFFVLSMNFLTSGLTWDYV